MNFLFLIPYLFSAFLINGNFDNDKVTIADIHAFHISRTSVNYDTQSKAYQLTIHVFVDDLTTCLEKKGYKNLNIGHKSESKITDQAIEKYIKEKVVLSDGKSIVLSYIGREFSEDGIALYCYFESSQTNFAKMLSVKNSLLFESFDDQKNIVDITKDKKRMGQLLCQLGSETQVLK